jgi:hypothetical protein
MQALSISPSVAAPAAAVIDVEVSSFDAWKAVFDAHGSSRKRAGLSASQVLHLVDSPERVTLFLAAPSFDTLGAFLASRERAEAMKHAGVVGTPHVSFVVPVEQQVLGDRPLAGTLLRHRVADFGPWKAGFDARATVRAEAGIVGHAICRGKDDPHDVIVYLQAEHLEQLERFLGSADLKEAMLRGGVQGTPRITLVQGYPFGS